MLEGIRVLDLTHFLAGPYCTLVLAELGADVVRVEDPDHLDEGRTMPPHFVGDQSAYYLSLNSVKRSLALRLTTPAGRRTFHRLAERVDVIVDNYRPGVMRKLGLDHETLSRLNPRLITCSITGFGEDGPYAGRAAYDYTITALAGIQHLTADPPIRPGVAYADHSGGLTAAVAILAALLERQGTGRGRHLDVGLLDIQLSMLDYLAAGVLNLGGEPGPISGGGHPVLVPSQNFQTSDGWIALFIGNDPMWERAKRALEAPNLEDARFDTVPGRSQHKAAVVALVAERVGQESTAYWTDRFDRNGVPCAPVNTVAQALNDPQALARGMVVEEVASYGRYRRTAGPLPRLRVRGGPAPRLGEDSESVLREYGIEPEG